MMTRYAMCKIMKDMSPGQSFYIEAPASVVHSYARKFGMKVSVQSCFIIIEPPKMQKILRVTVLGTDFEVYLQKQKEKKK